jgi:hypothetical protein
MISEITTFNGNICDFEKQFGVTFARQTASINSSNNMYGVHLLGSEWTKKHALQNRSIISLVAGLVPNTQQCGLGVLVFVDNGSQITGYEIWDINSNVISSGSVFSGSPNYDGGSPDAMFNATSDMTITQTDQNHIHIHATVDLSCFWGLFDVTLVNFDVDITLSPMEPI